MFGLVLKLEEVLSKFAIEWAVVDASRNFGSFGKYRNRTELPETEVVRFLPL